MNRKTSLKIGDALKTPDRKRAYNLRLFTEVAPRYDFINRVLSFGRDASWKEKLIAFLPAVSAPRCLDAACGTGDLARLLLNRFPDAHITAVDLTPTMLDIARRRHRGTSIHFVQGDMARLDIPDEHLDLLTGGYALRNAPDLNVFLLEIHRVLKPGGTAAFLDFSRPDSTWMAAIYFALLKFWGGFWGILLHRDPHVYGYIAESLERFPSRSDLHATFKRNGFILKRTRRFFAGVVEIIVMEKAGPS